MARLVYEIAIGAPGTPASWSACATRWARIAWTPAQFMRISAVPTPRAAGSRSRAEATSARISPRTRVIVPKPNTTRRVRNGLGLLGREERQRHVSLTAVRHDHEDQLAREVRAPRNRQRGRDRRPARDPHQKALPACGRSRRVQRRLVGNRDDLVDHGWVQDLGDEAGADALDLVR